MEVLSCVNTPEKDAENEVNWENIAGRVVGNRTVAEMAEKSGRECMPASRVQAIQANGDWLKEVVAGEYLPEWYPVDCSPLFRRVILSAVEERNFCPNLSGGGRLVVFVVMDAPALDATLPAS